MPVTSFTEQSFLYDHLVGEVKYSPVMELRDPDRIISVWRALYGCSQLYVALQETLFSRKQQEGETSQEFSLTLLRIMERVKQRAVRVGNLLAQESELL